MNSLLGHQKMTKKGAEHVHIGWYGKLVCAAGTDKSSAGGSRATQKHKTHDAGRSCFGVQQTLLPGFRVCRRRVPPAFAAGKLEVEPLLVMPGLVRGLQPNCRRDDVDGPVLRFWEHNKTATFGPHAAVRNTRSGPWDTGAAEGGPRAERSDVGRWVRSSQLRAH